MKTSIVVMAIGLMVPAYAADRGAIKYWPQADLRRLPADLRAALDKAPKAQVPYRHGVSPRHLMEESETANHYVDVIHRVQSGLAEWHDVKTDLYVVIDGGAKVVVGGTMPGKTEMRNRPGEWRAPKIAGGTEYRLAKGDMINIPSNTPHQVMLEPGKSITYIIVKIIDREK
ncbi:MAG: hypothetical protein GY953_11500 [bacterium]|nr:hypothetical protein [bacterium]